MRTVIGVAGAVLTLLVIADLVSAMLVPRGGRAPIGRLTLTAVTAAYRAAARLPRGFAAQHRILAAAAPVALLLQLVVYVAILIVTMGMVVYGLSPLDGTTSLYQSGSTLTTLGIVAPVTAASAIATFVAAFLGLVAIAVFIGYLLGLYSAFTARESLMAGWSLVAGEPAWAPAAFARGRALGLGPEAILDAGRWTDWACDLRTGLTVSPVLAWFRSTSPLRHWTTSLLSVLDCAALRLACEVRSTREADLLLVSEGIVTAQVISGSRGDANLDDELRVLACLASPEPAAVTGLSEADWQAGAPLLVEAGLLAPGDEPAAYRRFAAVRALYAPALTGLATSLHAVPAPWSGTREPALAPIVPALPGGAP